ncbi:MAG: hypothetical protein U0736_14800 [Gemmataceae bacterium]
MCDEWMPVLQLRLTGEEFRQLPRHPAYRYEYHAGTAWCNPRPRYYHAVLDLPAAVIDGAAEVPVRRIRDDDWEPLVPLFADAFAGFQPFFGQPEHLRRLTARQCLEQTRAGGDGPWVQAASYVAQASDGGLLGAILVTLLPLGDPSDWNTYSWDEPPAPDCVERRLGQPHLTWVFVHPRRAGRGVGSALLQASADVLDEMDYPGLLSTFLLGNESSMLWHWRAGFRLLTYPGSRRRER